MKKNIILLFAFFVFTNSFMSGQVIRTQWKQSIKKINDCEYDLIFTVSIDKGYHMPSVIKIKGTDGEVFPTEIIFKQNNDYTLIGALSETKPVSEYDATIGKTVFLHYNKVTFTQRIKLNSAGKLKIDGTYKYQICNNVACDFPPKDPFSFNLQGTTICKK